MATSMHRLQVCLPESQVQYLTHRAQREGVSIAELVRRLVEEATRSSNEEGTGSLWEIAGIGEEHEPLIHGIPVSRKPQIYLAATIHKKSSHKRKSPTPKRKSR